MRSEMHTITCTCAPGCRARKLRAELSEQEHRDTQAWLDARKGIVRESRLMKSIREKGG